jgi:hypothetical protein
MQSRRESETECVQKPMPSFVLTVDIAGTIHASKICDVRMSL